MLTVWGTLNQVHRDDASVDWVQVKTVLPDRTTIRIRAMIGHQTTVVRGIQRVDPTSLKVGDVVEVSYCHGHNGGIEAKTVYVFPDEATMSQGVEDEIIPCRYDLRINTDGVVHKLLTNPFEEEDWVYLSQRTIGGDDLLHCRLDRMRYASTDDRTRRRGMNCLRCGGMGSSLQRSCRMLRSRRVQHDKELKTA